MFVTNTEVVLPDHSCIHFGVLFSAYWCLMRTSSITLDTVEQKTVLIGSLKLGCCHRRPLADRRVLTEPVKILARPERAGKPPERERADSRIWNEEKGHFWLLTVAPVPSLWEGWLRQIGWIFGKIPNGLRPLLILGKLCCKFFIMDMVKYMQGGTRAR